MNDIELMFSVQSQLMTEVACNVSVLISTYASEKAQWLAEALESLFAQSVTPDQLVLVVDGPIASDQEVVIAQYQNDPRIQSVEIVRLSSNQGLANAMNAGLAVCKGKWIMRMDSDDVCHVDRLAIQLDYVDKYPDVDIFSSWSEEFSDEDSAVLVKASPIEHDAIVNALRWRNVIVHPSNLIRASTLRRLEGYRAKYGKLEDYDLYVRMALAGARFRVIPAKLVRQRVSHASCARRGGWRYIIGEFRFRIFCLQSGFLNVRQFLLITISYTMFRLVGAGIRGWLYRFTRA